MKLITCEINGVEKVAVLTADNKVFTLEALGVTPSYDLPGHSLSMTDIIRMWNDEFAKKIEGADYGAATSLSLDDVKLLAPIPRPEQDIICLGLNYAEHAVEAKHFDNIFEAERAVAVYFSKRATYCQASGDVIPSHSDLTEKLDYESELAVIIGNEATNVKPEDVEKYIFGYTIMNDVSAREVQRGHKQWYFGKSLDGFAPMGPCIVTKDEIAFPPKLNIGSIVNGEMRQNSNTENFVHTITDVICELSKGMTLKAGTIIATGTPAGVAMGMENPVFLKPGDEVICFIERIGELRNIVE